MGFCCRHGCLAVPWSAAAAPATPGACPLKHLNMLSQVCYRCAPHEPHPLAYCCASPARWKLQSGQCVHNSEAHGCSTVLRAGRTPQPWCRAQHRAAAHCLYCRPPRTASRQHKQHCSLTAQTAQQESTQQENTPQAA
jgi:hypothetical protein